MYIRSSRDPSLLFSVAAVFHVLSDPAVSPCPVAIVAVVAN